MLKTFVENNSEDQVVENSKKNTKNHKILMEVHKLIEVKEL